MLSEREKEIGNQNGNGPLNSNAGNHRAMLPNFKGLNVQLIFYTQTTNQYEVSRLREPTGTKGTQVRMQRLEVGAHCSLRLQ